MTTAHTSILSLFSDLFVVIHRTRLDCASRRGVFGFAAIRLIRASHFQFAFDYLIYSSFRDMMHSASFISDACQHEAVAHVMYITSNQFNPSRAREIGGEIHVSIYNSLLLNSSIIWNLDLFHL